MQKVKFFLVFLSAVMDQSFVSVWCLTTVVPEEQSTEHEHNDVVEESLGPLVLPNT